MRDTRMFGSMGLLALAALVACPTLSGAEGRPEVPGAPLPFSGSKKTVMFDHLKGHKDIECVVCHHRVDGKETYAKCANEACHFDLTAKKGVDSLYYVVHSKSKELKHATCLSCHTRTVAEKPDIKKQMTGCSQSWCHPGQKDSGEDAES